MKEKWQRGWQRRDKDGEGKRERRAKRDSSRAVFFIVAINRGRASFLRGRRKKERERDERGARARKNGAILQNKRALQSIENQYRTSRPDAFFPGRKRVYSPNWSFLIFAPDSSPLSSSLSLPLTPSFNSVALNGVPRGIFRQICVRRGVSAGIKLATPETRWILSVPLTGSGNVLGKTILRPARYRPPRFARSGINISVDVRYDSGISTVWLFKPIRVCTRVRGLVARCWFGERVCSFSDCVAISAWMDFWLIGVPRGSIIVATLNVLLSGENYGVGYIATMIYFSYWKIRIFSNFNPCLGSDANPGSEFFLLG